MQVKGDARRLRILVGQGRETQTAFVGLRLGLLLFLISGCSSTSISTTSETVSASSPGSLSAAGIEADTRYLTSSEGESDLEVTVTTYLRPTEQACAEDQECPDEYSYMLRSSALLDYGTSSAAGSEEITLETGEAESSLGQILTFEDVEPAGHCLVVFSQILRLSEDGSIVGREGVIGAYEHLTPDSEGSQQASSQADCLTTGITTADGTFVPLDGSSCGGLPNGITSDLSGNALPDEDVLVLVPTCPQSLVAVVLHNGEIVPEHTRLVAGQDESGYLAYVLPRLSGRWRVATLPDQRYQGTVPDDSAYWDVVISPPREF